jgi:hypothetical protein
MKDVRNGFLVFVTEYRNNAIEIGSKNHQFRGAKAPDSKTPLKMAKTKLTIREPQSFDLCLLLNHIVFAARK